ncbi:YDG domain-containing protein [Phenylobacterium parvum]|uniref:Filamentous haemagglutinin FhaB/tRNA nuclease CdiA-like TPS domain-containing protein n=1 Tax=Phenylobacterium parvum TaxID=2201350 RepID=A0A2Z3HRI9_9CAUL|nr:YDG domain-containing protein [Phenylobacterium parvum]AWM77405.1 hypothetical protein HYN04_06270 [Phenylobacterium parvum]
MKHQWLLGASVFGLLAASPALSQALPQGGQVSAGDASVSAGKTSLTITQSTPRAILNWSSFSVGQGASVHFANGRGATLNRVTGGDLSRIDGGLSASGSVYLLNPAGILIGPGGEIATGGSFLASTLDLSDADFLGGGALSFSGDSQASVINLGRIGASGGDILLLSRTVENGGEIEAHGGAAVLASGSRVTLAEAGAAGARLQVELGAPGGGVTQSGRIRAAMVDLATQGGNIYALAGNLGGEVLASGAGRLGGRVTISAGEGSVQVDPGVRIAASSGPDGGQVSISGNLVFNQGILDASGRRGGEVSIAGGAVFNTGRISAAGNRGDGGRIAVVAARTYTETASGEVTATGTARGGAIAIDGGANLYTSGSWSASAPGGVGGAIVALGSRIVLNEAALSADGGLGGRIRIGGDYRGLGDLRPALEVLSTPGTRVSATSEYARYGGSVVYWSTGLTEVWGRTFAAGAGLIEVSSKGDVRLGGLADAGVGGQVLLDPKSIVIDASSGLYPQYELIDPHFGSDNNFGAQVVPLSTGNVVVTASFDSSVALRAGAVYLFNGTTGALLSTVVGSRADDRVGYWVEQLIGNGNFVISSPNWSNGAAAGAGAATWGSGVTGVSGVVSAANSLTGVRTADQVGRITPLTNGHYVVTSGYWDNGAIADAGAVTFGNGATGVTGAVSAANSLVGSTAGDRVGLIGSGCCAYPGIFTLSNGNLVVSTPNWSNGAAAAAGAVTWMNGTTGLTGTINASNSLIGSTAGDQIGSGRTWELANGNFITSSTHWDNGAAADAGMVAWGSGVTGITGLVSASNSLVGGSAGDLVGSYTLPLSNGSYVIGSAYWDNGAITDAGALTWASGTGSTVGLISVSNSLVGSQIGDRVGYAVFPLTNGNYVGVSPDWDNGATTNVGAVSWGSGLGGTVGSVSASNSLVGAGANDRFGSIASLTNGNYVAFGAINDGAASNVGIAVWASGSGPTSGVVDLAMGLHGSSAGDGAAIDVIPLANGNYVVTTPFWSLGAISSVGAVTWGNGLGGTTGAISASKSLIGSTAQDRVGIGGMVALPNGNYYVSSLVWNNGAALEAGAVTWGNGLGATVGVVSASNSLVGLSTGDYVGGYTLLMDGGYAITLTPSWDSGVLEDAGAVTWLSPTGGTVGAVSAANSLVGSHAFDYVGDQFSLDNVLSLPGGNYTVSSQDWNGVGAVTFGKGTTGVSGVVSSINSILGVAPGDRIRMRWSPYLGDGSVFFVNGNKGRVFVGLTDLNQLTYNRATGQTVTLLPAHLTAQLATGSSLTLQASNDITINSPVIVPGASGGDLTLQAGRSLLINAGITTAGGDINLYANTLLSSGVVDADRDPGAAVITMAGGTSLDAGTGDIRIHLGPGTGKTHLTSGAITLGSLSGASIRVDNVGTSSGSDIILRPGATLSATGAGDAIRLAANGNFINNAGAASLSAAAGRWLVYSQLTGSAGLAPTGNVTGGLTGKAWYGAPYTFSASGFGSFASAPGPGNRFVYGFQPVLNVSVDAVSVTYTGSAPAAGSFNVTGLRAGDSAADAWSGAPALGGLAAWNVGTYAVTPTLGTLVSGLNYGFSFTPGNLTITPAALQVQAVTDSRAYNGTATSSLTPLVTGLQGTDAIPSLSQVFDSRNAGARTLSVAPFTVSDGNGGANYTVTTLSAAGSIAPAPLSLTAASASRAYDGTTTASGAPVAAGLFAGDTVSGVTQAFDSRNAGPRSVMITGYVLNDGNAGGNYTVTLNSAAGSISRALLSLTASAASRTYDGSIVAPGTPIATGLAPGDSVSNLSQAFDSRNAGTRTVTVTGYTVNDGNAGGNYTVSLNSAQGSIGKALLTLSATPASKTYDGSTAASGTPTVSGLVSGDTVSGLSQGFDSRNAGARTVSVTGYTLNDGNGGGNYTVRLDTAAGAISRALLTLSASAQNKTYDGSAAAAGTPVASGLIAGDSVSGLSQAFDSRNAGARTLSVTGYAVNDGNGGGNYTVVLNSASGAIARAVLTVTATSETRVYDGGTGSAGTPTVSGLVAGDSVGGLAQAFDTPDAGARTLSVTAYTLVDGAGGANYQVRMTPAAGTITPLPLSIAADDASRLAGLPDPVFTWRLTSGQVLARDALSGLLAREPGESPGLYAILLGGLTAGPNYRLDFTPGFLRITPGAVDDLVIRPLPAFLPTPPPSVRDETGVTRVVACGGDAARCAPRPGVRAGAARPLPAAAYSQ